MAWFTGGALTNPAINAIMADTGALVNGGTSTVTMIVSSTVAAAVVLEQRDAANALNITSHIFPVAANTPLSVEFPAVGFAPNERFRVRLNAAITGQAQVSLFAFP
jgi:hypothetical protein